MQRNYITGNFLKSIRVILLKHGIQSTNYLVDEKNKNKIIVDKLISNEHDIPQIHETPEQIVEAFNEFFVKVGPNLAGQIPDVHKSFKEYLPNPVSEIVSLVTCDTS